MKQLTGIDVSFLNLETSRSFGHVSGLAVYRRPDDDFDPYLTFRTQLEERLPDLEPFRRRLVEVPMGLDRPYWINDPDFDLDFHLRHIAVPGRRGQREVEQLVARLIGRPMDRTRPLWESYVIEGLPDDRFGVLTKLHHATIDGAAGAELLTMLLAPPTTDPGDDPWRPEHPPSSAELLARTAVEMVRAPAKAVRLQVRALSELGRVTETRGFNEMANQIRRGLPGPAGVAVRRLLGDERPIEDDAPPLTPTMGGPRTPFNATITAQRDFAYRTSSLDDIKKIKNATGATVNDVVMAICAGALRRYLEGHEALPDRNLVAMVPVSIRTGDEVDKWSNRVSAIFAELPTTEDEPLDRLDGVHQAMVEAKGQFDLVPAETLVEMSDLAPPALAARAARIAARTRLADWTNPPANLVISNVPGPRVHLEMAGAPLEHYYPVSTVVDGQGLNITVQSYVDRLDWGLVACADLVPDLGELADMLLEEADRLLDAIDED